jgi:hypothetical protein
MIHTSKVTKADSLTPQEVALAQVIQRAINSAWGRVDEREIARALRDLNATQINQIVDSLSIRLSDRAIVNQLSRAVTSSVGATAKNIRAVLRGQNNNLPRQVNPLNAGEFINLDPTNLPSYLRPTLTEFNFRTTDQGQFFTPQQEQVSLSQPLITALVIQSDKSLLVLSLTK